jgi:hypothetical protein
MSDPQELAHHEVRLHGDTQVRHYVWTRTAQGDTFTITDPGGYILVADFQGRFVKALDFSNWFVQWMHHATKGLKL